MSKSTPRPEEQEQDVVLDDHILDQIARDTSPAFMPQMVTVFITEIRRRGRALQQGLDQNDPDTVRHQTHALKSGAGTFGVIRLQRTTILVDSAFKAGDPETAMARARILPGQIREAIGALSKRFHLEM